MTITTAFTELIGCRHPNHNAGMGTALPVLGAAVAHLIDTLKGITE